MPKFKEGQIKFYKPLLGSTIKITPLAEPLPYVIHLVPSNTDWPWPWPQNIICPICKLLTAETRACEFTEAQVGWTGGF